MHTKQVKECKHKNEDENGSFRVHRNGAYFFISRFLGIKAPQIGEDAALSNTAVLHG